MILVTMSRDRERGQNHGVHTQADPCRPRCRAARLTV
jgi:hypothetical protein